MNYKNMIIEELKKMNMKIGIAESVTGGMIASALVDVPGASKVFKGGVVSYTIDSKVKLLGINREIINKFGEVSAQTAREMALGIKRKLETDFSIAVTGLAGPFPENLPANQKKCIAYFSIIVIDKSYDYEMTAIDAGRTENRITIASKVIEELFKLIYRVKADTKDPLSKYFD